MTGWAFVTKLFKSFRFENVRGQHIAQLGLAYL